MPPSVFLSHSSRDNTFCERLALDLLEYEVKVWYDEWEIKVGDSLRAKIASGIEQNDYLAVVLSRASVQSPWVQQELNAALDKELTNRKVFVLPVLIEDCDIPVFLRDKKWGDFRHGYKAGLRQLLSVLAVKKRRRRRSAGQSIGSHRRNDELALRPDDCEEWFLDQLEEANPIRLQRFLWNWRSAAQALALQSLPDQIPAKQLDLDATGQDFLERIAVAGSILLRYQQDELFLRLADLLYDLYLLLNGRGIQQGASIDMNVRAAEARCKVLDIVF